MDKKRILIIDDEEDFTQLVKLNLEQTKRYEVWVENKGAEGLEAAKSFNPDLILLDIIMPDLEGSEVASRIKNDAETKDIPIVFLTAAATKEEVSSSGGIIGGHPFLAKPVSTQELIDCIDKNIILGKI
jgi:CheY-like chemotaxis protein